MPTVSRPDDPFLKRMLLLSNSKPGRRIEKKSSHGDGFQAPALSFTQSRGCCLAELKQRGARAGELRETPPAAAAAPWSLDAIRHTASPGATPSDVTKRERTSERSSMTCCCSRTCSRRNSISCSSLVRLRSFKEVCRFRDACADSFSFCSQRESAQQEVSYSASTQREVRGHPAGGQGAPSGRSGGTQREVRGLPAGGQGHPAGGQGAPSGRSGGTQREVRGLPAGGEGAPSGRSGMQEGRRLPSPHAGGGDRCRPEASRRLRERAGQAWGWEVVVQTRALEAGRGSWGGKARHRRSCPPHIGACWGAGRRAPHLPEPQPSCWKRGD